MKKVLRIRPKAILHRRYPGTKFRVYPDPNCRGTVEVHISRTHKQMLEDCAGWAPPKDYPPNPLTMGEVRSYIYLRGVRRNTGKMRPNAVVAHMFLNRQDLRNRPGEIVSHECAHAAMAWVRLHRVNLGKMVGEEVLCHAVGRLVAQVNRVCYAAGAFRG